MKPLPLLAALALLASPATAATCKRLTDTDSAFISSFSLVTNPTDQDAAASSLVETLAPVDTAFPWLSKCLASIDPVAVLATTALSNGYKTCNSSLSAFAMPDTMDDATLRSKLCPFYKDTVLPCLLNVPVQAFVDAMAASGGCCGDMQSQIKTSFGSDLKAMATELLTRLGSLVCTVKTFTTSAGNTASESCGNSLLAAFTSGDNLGYVLSLFQLPTDQVCSAMAGKVFTTTLGESAQFKWASQNLESVGICYEPASRLIKMLGGYPIMATMTGTANDGAVTVAMADLFTTGKCLASDAFFAYLLDDSNALMTTLQSIDELAAASASEANGTNLTVAIKATLTSYQGMVPKMCLRLASGQTCDYGTATTTTAFAMDGEEVSTATGKSPASLPALSTGLLVILAVFVAGYM